MNDESTKAFLINPQQVATSQRVPVPMVTLLACGFYISVASKDQVKQLLRACQYALGMERAP